MPYEIVAFCSPKRGVIYCISLTIQGGDKVIFCFAFSFVSACWPLGQIGLLVVFFFCRKAIFLFACRFVIICICGIVPADYISRPLPAKIKSCRSVNSGKNSKPVMQF